jgi:hypothetical protein
MLRHLVFATDAWVKRAILGEPSPWDRLDLPHDRMATVRQVITDLTAVTCPAVLRRAGMSHPAAS